MSDAKVPGTTIPIPVAPDLGPCLGYAGGARYLAVCYEEDHVLVIDGRSIVQGNLWAYQVYRRYPRPRITAVMESQLKC